MSTIIKYVVWITSFFVIIEANNTVGDIETYTGLQTDDKNFSIQAYSTEEYAAFAITTKPYGVREAKKHDFCIHLDKTGKATLQSKDPLTGRIDTCNLHTLIMLANEYESLKDGLVKKETLNK
jgi:hypothetical protein